MHNNHTLVWIDHTEAKLFDIGHTEADAQRIADAGPRRSVHSRRDHVERAESPDEHRFMLDIAGALANATGILIVGPGEARTELQSFLQSKFPGVAANIWAVEAIDHPSDPQLVAYGHTFFHREERMR